MSAAAVAALLSGTYLLGEWMLRACTRFQQVSRDIDAALSESDS